MKRGSFAAPNGNWCGSLSGVGTSGSGNAWPPNSAASCSANQVRAVERSRAQWRDQAEAARQRVQELEQVLAEQKEPDRPADAAAACPRMIEPAGWGAAPRGHQYSVGIIGTFVELILAAPLSLRGASGAIQHIFRRLFGRDISTPCANTGRLWILRLGLHELARPKEPADDWVWLVDHTIQLDAVQCLLVVGVRLHQWQQDRRPLEHQDLELLLLHPGTESTGEVIRDQLLRVVAMTGVPRAHSHRRRAQSPPRDCPLSRTVPARDSQR